MVSLSGAIGMGMVLMTAILQDALLFRQGFDSDVTPLHFEPGARLVEGRTDRAIVAAASGPCALTLPATGHLDLRRGTVAFWFRPVETLRALPRREETNLIVLHQGETRTDNSTRTATKVWNVFLAQPGSVRLRGETFDRDGHYHGTQIEYLRLYADRWYHFAFSWDSERGTVCQYLNGRLEQQIDSPPWEPQPLSGTLWIGNPWLALDEVAIFGRMLNHEEIAAMAGFPAGAELTDEGAIDYNQLFDPAPWRGQAVLQCDFSDSDALRDWVMEGEGSAAVENQRLVLRADRKQHIVYWHKALLPDDLLIEYDFAPLADEGLCILFFCAAGSHGRDLFDPSLAPRNGVFSQYTQGDIVAYHVSYYRNRPDPSTICNLRKNPGMPLFGAGRDPIPPRPGGVHHLALLKQGNRIRFAINGQLVIDATDEEALLGPPLGAGRLAFRHMWPMAAAYDNLVVYRLAR